MSDDLKVYRELGALAQAARNAINSSIYHTTDAAHDMAVLDRLAAAALGVSALIPAGPNATSATSGEPGGEPSAPSGAYRGGVVAGALEHLLHGAGR